MDAALGDREENLRRLMARYKSDLMRMCCACLRDAALAEDAVQETFVKAYRAMAGFRGEGSEKAWLSRIALNTCRNLRRDRWFRFVDRRVTPETLPLQAASAEDRGLVEAVMRLPYGQKEAVLLYYYQGLNLKEIAEAMGIAVSTVSTRLKRARERLRFDLEGGEEHV